MVKLRIRCISLALLAAILAGAVSLMVSGCGESKVTVLSFYTENNESAKEFKEVLDKAKDEYKDDVVFKYYDMDDPANKGTIKKYKVNMDPTFIILNTKGEIKQSYMGKPHEQMFMSAIGGLIPSKEKVKTPGSTPGPTMSQPAPSSVPNIPGIPTP